MRAHLSLVPTNRYSLFAEPLIGWDAELRERSLNLCQR